MSTDKLEHPRIVSRVEWLNDRKILLARGGEFLIGAYSYLDLVPKGRDETGLPFTMAWVRHHDRYSNE
jgi:Bacterial protein of unknown function (DUF899)